MHKMYAKFLGGVQAEFALHIRKSPIRLCALARERPDLFRELQAHVQKLTDVQPFSPAVQRALAVHAAHFTLTPVSFGVCVHCRCPSAFMCPSSIRTSHQLLLHGVGCLVMMASAGHGDAC